MSRATIVHIWANDLEAISFAEFEKEQCFLENEDSSHGERKNMTSSKSTAVENDVQTEDIQIVSYY